MSEDGLKMSDKEREAIELLSSFEEEKPRISEELFVSRYLPLLASRQTGVDVTPWLQVAGNAYRSVEVVKDGKVLFTVPPLLRQIPTKIHRRGAESVLEIVETSRLHAAQHPRVGQYYLEQHLQGAVDPEPPEESALKEWYNVLKGYGYDVAATADADSASDNGDNPKVAEPGPDIFAGGIEEL